MDDLINNNNNNIIHVERWFQHGTYIYIYVYIYIYIIFHEYSMTDYSVKILFNPIVSPTLRQFNKAMDMDHV